jgi:hypothetical protein
MEATDQAVVKHMALTPWCSGFRVVGFDNSNTREGSWRFLVTLVILVALSRVDARLTADRCHGTLSVALATMLVSRLPTSMPVWPHVLCGPVQWARLDLIQPLHLVLLLMRIFC